MSGERQDCAATVFAGRAGSFPCYRKGPFKEGGKFWCFQHAPSKVAERCAQAAKKYDDEWKARDAAELQAENKIWNEAIEAAAELMESHVLRSSHDGHSLTPIYGGLKGGGNLEGRVRAAAIRKLRKE